MGIPSYIHRSIEQYQPRIESTADTMAALKARGAGKASSILDPSPRQYERARKRGQRSRHHG